MSEDWLREEKEIHDRYIAWMKIHSVQRNRAPEIPPPQLKYFYVYVLDYCVDLFLDHKFQICSYTPWFPRHEHHTLMRKHFRGKMTNLQIVGKISEFYIGRMIIPDQPDYTD